MPGTSGKAISSPLLLRECMCLGVAHFACPRLAQHLGQVRWHRGGDQVPADLAPMGSHSTCAVQDVLSTVAAAQAASAELAAREQVPQVGMLALTLRCSFGGPYQSTCQRVHCVPAPGRCFSRALKRAPAHESECRHQHCYPAHALKPEGSPTAPAA